MSMLGLVTLYALLLAAPVIAVLGRPVDSRFRIGHGREGKVARAVPRAPSTHLIWAGAMSAAVLTLFLLDRELVDQARAAAGVVLHCFPDADMVDVACRARPEATPDRATHWLGLMTAAGGATAAFLLRRQTIYLAVLALLGWVATALSADLLFARVGADAGTLAITSQVCSGLLATATVAGLALARTPTARQVAIAIMLYGYGLVFRLVALDLAAILWPHLFAASQAALLAFAVVFPVSALSVLCLVGPIAGRRPEMRPTAHGHACPPANSRTVDRLLTEPAQAHHPPFAYRATVTKEY